MGADINTSNINATTVATPHTTAAQAEAADSMEMDGHDDGRNHVTSPAAIATATHADTTVSAAREATAAYDIALAVALDSAYGECLPVRTSDRVDNRV